MNYQDWRSMFFNVHVTGTHPVVNQVHRGHPYGVPRIEQGLQPRGAQPHERGFINTNSAINQRFDNGVEQGQFAVTGPAVIPIHGTIAYPLGTARTTFATPAAFRSNSPSAKPGIGGGGSTAQ